MITCACKCIKLGLFFTSWLCSMPNLPETKENLLKKGCPSIGDYVYRPPFHAGRCDELNGLACRGWQAVYVGENPIPKDWVYTDGNMRSCLEAKP